MCVCVCVCVCVGGGGGQGDEGQKRIAGNDIIDSRS